MRTLNLRMQKHAATAMEVATWLERQPQIKRVLFPALPSDDGYDLWKQQFSGAPGPFTVELQPCSEAAFEAFINALQLFGLGTSWGGYESLVIPAIAHHLRALPKAIVGIEIKVDRLVGKFKLSQNREHRDMHNAGIELKECDDDLCSGARC